MTSHRRMVACLLTLAPAAFSCKSGGDSGGSEAVASTQEAIHGTATDGASVQLDADTMWPAVGFVTLNLENVPDGGKVVASGGGVDASANGTAAISNRYCSGTLVGRRTVLTSAHCLLGFNDPCHPLDKTTATALYGIIFFAFNTAGNGDLDGGHPEQTQVYAIEEVRTAPHAWDFEHTDAGGLADAGDLFAGPLQVCDASADAAYQSGTATQVWVNHAQDQALLTLKVGPGQLEPADYVNSKVDGGNAAPLQMITSYEDDAFSPFGLHVTGVGDSDGGEPDSGVTPWEVGWSWFDNPAPNGRRSAGPVQFVQPATYGPLLSMPFGDLPTPEPEAESTGAYVYYLDSIQVSPGIGDSGGPAALLSTGVGVALPKGAYVLGNLTATFGLDGVPVFFPKPWSWYSSTFFQAHSMSIDFSNSWWLESRMWVTGDYFTLPAQLPFVDGVSYGTVDTTGSTGFPLSPTSVDANTVFSPGRDYDSKYDQYVCKGWYAGGEQVGAMTGTAGECRLDTGLSPPPAPYVTHVPISKILQYQPTYLAGCLEIKLEWMPWNPSVDAYVPGNALEVGYTQAEPYMFPATALNQTPLYACQATVIHQTFGRFVRSGTFPGTMQPNGTCTIFDSNDVAAPNTASNIQVLLAQPQICVYPHAPPGPIQWWRGDFWNFPWMGLSTGPVTAFFQEGNSVTIGTHSFTAGALSLLSEVASGTAQMILADDVFSVPLGAKPGAVLVQPGTTSVTGALAQPGGLVVASTGIVTAPSADPPELVSFDASDVRLYALQVTPTTATIVTVDVNAALQGVVSTSSTPVTGVIPSAPLAMMWNVFTQTLYVMDSIAESELGKDRGDGHEGRGAARLRLLTIVPATGVSSLVWQTRPTRDLPDRVMMSVGVPQEIAVGLVGVPDHDSTEVVIMDASGEPLLSEDFDGRLAGPPHAVPIGVDLAFETRRPDLMVDFKQVLSADLDTGLCGESWLEDHADLQDPQPSVLAEAEANCHHHDHHHE